MVFPRILNAMFGMKFKVVAGYEGVNMVSIAVERGEVERHGAAVVDHQDGARPEWLREGKINLLCSTRSRVIRNCPTCLRSSTWRRPRSSARCSAATRSGSDIGRSIVAPPGVPADTVAALRRAFMAAMRDPALLADVARAVPTSIRCQASGCRRSCAQAVAVLPRAVEQAKRFRPAADNVR